MHPLNLFSPVRELTVFHVTNSGLSSSSSSSSFSVSSFLPLRPQLEKNELLELFLLVTELASLRPEGVENADDWMLVEELAVGEGLGASRRLTAWGRHEEGAVFSSVRTVSPTSSSGGAML